MARALAFGRVVIAWGTLAAFMVFGEAWLADLASPVKSTALLFWLFVVIIGYLPVYPQSWKHEDNPMAPFHRLVRRSLSSSRSHGDR
jgi:hypothetical protein